MHTVKPHWLTPGGKTKTPSCVISFDTETSEIDAGDHTVQKLRCWDAIVRQRHLTGKRSTVTTHRAGESAPALCDLVEANTATQPEVWVIAHNVSFDLAVTSLPFLLVDRGWTLDAFHLGDESTWWVLKLERRKVIITDSWSWLRCGLTEAAADINRRKLRLPGQHDSLTDWHRRCKHDAEILDELMVTLMDWWDEHQLGAFGITGAACGWRTLRAVIKPKKVLVGPEGERTDYERRAVYGGWKDVFGVGEFHDTWMADWDINAAYPTSAAAFALPMTPEKPWTDTQHLLSADPPAGRDYIAEVEITTHVPCAPCRIDKEIWYPVGTFRTVLTGPEVRYVQTVADSVTVLNYRAYRVGFALADWAAWCLTIQYATADEVPPVVSRVAKGWGRSVIGRFASRTSRVISEQPSLHAGWHLSTGHDLDTGRVLDFISIGGVEQTICRDLDGSDVFPAVLAFVEAHTRVALAQILATRDPRLVLQCNTDGWWEMKADRRSDYTPAGIPWPFRVSRKALERRLLVRGPNHVLTPSERRYAGIPAEAIDDGHQGMKWHDWPGLRWQLEHGATGEYHRPERAVTLAEHYVRRWVLTSGETVPVTVLLDDNATPTIQPWCRSWGQLETDVLAPYQVPTLVKLNESDTDLGDVEPDSLPVQMGRGFPSAPRGSS